MRNLAATLLAALVAFGAWAATEIVDGVEWTYTIENGEAFVGPSSYKAIPTSTSGAIIIPSTLSGYPVTHICYRAFAGCGGLTSVTIPDSVITIDRWAFEDCDGLKEFIVSEDNPSYKSESGLLLSKDGKTIVAIPKGAESVAIPDSVTTLDQITFYGCTNLMSVTIGDGITRIEDSMFERCYNLTNVTIGSSVTSIGRRAFLFCDSLAYVTIPGNVETIEGMAFLGCTNLLSVSIGNGVTDIWTGAFCGCSKLTSVTIPDSVTYIEKSVFVSCTSITNVTIPQAVFDNSARDFRSIFDGASELTVVLSGNVTNICDGAFRACTNLTNIEISDNVTRIGDGAFSGCSGLTSVTIPNSVTSIGGYAFSGCTNLTSITIPNGVELIGNSAFSGCSELTSITIPNSVTNIGSGAFYNCSGLTSVTIPDSVTSIGGSAFSGCSGLTRVTIPQACMGNRSGDFRWMFQGSSELTVVLSEGVTNVCDWAFSGCTNLTSVIIGGGVTSIGYYAFSGCSGLTSLTIGDGVEHIGDRAFRGCSGLTSVAIPDSVVYIGQGAFEGCSGLTSLTIGDGVEHIGDRAFRGCSGLRNVTTSQAGLGNYRPNHYPHGDNFRTLFADSLLELSVVLSDGVTNICDYAFSDCTNLASVVIQDSVRSIGASAFHNCSGLTSVTIPGSVTSISSYAFYGCIGLKSFSVASGNLSYKAVSGLLLTKDGKILACVPKGRTSVTIPDSVVCIGDLAFSGCNRLTSVTIPDSVTSIGYRAFYDCSGLTSVAMPNEVTNIWDYAFYNCCELADITMPDGVANIGPYTFYGCISLTSVTIPNSVTTIGYSAFRDCSGLVSVTMTDNVTTIGDRAFYGCSALRRVAVPQCVCDSQMDLVFSAAYQQITNVVVLSSVTNIGYRAFFGCDALVCVTLPDGLTSVASEAFSGCGSLPSVALPRSVASIESYAFLNCSSLTNVKMPWIQCDSSVFSGCSSELVIRYWDEKKLILKPNLLKCGTVSGEGIYPIGMKATLKAKAKKGYVFAGWFTDKACTKALNPKGYDNRKPTVKVAMPAKNTTIYAKFVTKDEDKKALKFKSATKKLAKTPTKATAGEAFSLKLGVSSASLPTFTAKGLPKGLSIDKATGEITGVGTVPGSYTATVTVKSAAGNKITQKVKITVNVPAWAKGTFYGLAYPGVKSDDSWAYLKFTATEAGKVSGKVMYNGKSYSFTSSYKSCTAKKATFAPKIKIGSKTFKPGTVTVKTQNVDGLKVVAATDKYGFVTAQKKSSLVKKGKPLAALVGERFTFTKKDANSGLFKTKDTLVVTLGNDDAVTVSGVVGGKKFAPISWVALVADPYIGSWSVNKPAYTLYVDIIDAALKYERTLVLQVYFDNDGQPRVNAKFQ